MEFFRGQIAELWAKSKNEVASKNQPLSPPANEESLQELVNSIDKDITYEHLKKNADKYSGQAWAFTGKIFQIQENGGQTVAIVSLDVWGDKLMYVTADFTTDFVDKDQVYVVGTLVGNHSYKSVADWDVTIPAINARAILKPKDAAKLKTGKHVKK